MSHPQPPYGQQQYPQQQHPYGYGQQQGYGQPGYGQQQPYGQPMQGAWGAGVQVEGGAERLAFLRKVYGLFAGSVLLSAIGAFIALYAGADSSTVAVEGVKVPPLVAVVAGMPWIGLLLLGVVFGASMVRRVKVVNVMALFGMAFLFGIYVAPALFVAQLNAATGTSMSASPVRDAFLLAVLMFGGLTAYTWITKKDFSYLGGALSMGLLVVLGCAILNIFLGSSVFGLAIASVGLILFGGYVLYDTSRILHTDDRDAVGGAIQLYFDFLNIFLYLLRILGSRR